MPGLSKDPNAAQRQLDGLAKGRRALALRVLGVTDEQVASLGTPAPPARAPAKARAKASPGTPPEDRVTYPEPKEPPSAPRPREEPEEPDERRPGFFDGLLQRF